MTTAEGFLKGFYVSTLAPPVFLMQWPERFFTAMHTTLQQFSIKFIMSIPYHAYKTLVL